MTDDRKTDRRKVKEIEEDMPSRADPRRGDTVATEGMIATPLAGLMNEGAGSDMPMTSEQADQLRALSEAKGEPFDTGLTRGEAERKIEDLKSR